VDEAPLVNTFGPEYRPLLIGAGQLSQCLAGMAVVRDMPDDVVQAFRADVRTAVAALTHDPKLDDLALLEALERLRGPIGLYAVSKTPSEIGVSVMTEIVATKNRVALPAEMDVQTAKNLA
jgi:xanthine dehydrogenase accessory factor